METNLEKIKDLLTNKKYNELKKILNELNSADIPGILEEFDKEDVIRIFRLLSKEQAGEAFSYMESDMREKLLEDLTDRELKSVIDELFMDDTVDLIEEMPSNVVKRILKLVNKEDRNTINELLKYPEDSAGSIMTTEFIDLKENMTAEQALKRIRKIGTDSETIYTCYVLTEKRILKGIINIKDILIAPKEKLIKELMETNIISANTLEDQEEVAKKFDKYDFYALPVVDNESRLVGIITVDDAINVLQDEAQEDFEKMAAITGNILAQYEAAFAVAPLLVAFIPMIMGTGGNCGSQSSTLIIRGLATDEIKLKDIFRVIWKEIRVAFIVGVALAIVNAIRVIIQYRDIQLAVVLGITLIVTTIISKVLGCVLPMLAKRLKLDPAIMAAPLITTLVDVCSILVYFQVATSIMGL